MNIQRSNVRQITGFKPLEYYVVACFYPRHFDAKTGRWHPAETQAIVNPEWTEKDALELVRERTRDGVKIEFVHRVCMGEAPEDLTDEMVSLVNDQIALADAE